MGTRGLMAFTYDGKTKAMYNHWDSYPSGLGKDIAKWIKTANIPDAIFKFERLRKVDPDVPPTEGQKMLLESYADLNVSSRSLDDWYVLLRETQGDPQATLNARYYMDGTDIGGQEYGYNIDLTRQVLEVYICDYSKEETTLGEGYKLVRTYSFDSLREGQVDFFEVEEELNREMYPEDYED